MLDRKAKTSRLRKAGQRIVVAVAMLGIALPLGMLMAGVCFAAAIGVAVGYVSVKPESDGSEDQKN
jgi:hypothetical protein